MTTRSPESLVDVGDLAGSLGGNGLGVFEPVDGEGALRADRLAAEELAFLRVFFGLLGDLLHESVDVDSRLHLVNGLVVLEQVLAQLMLLGGGSFAVSGEAHAAAVFSLLAGGFGLTLAGDVLDLVGLAGGLQGLEGLLVLLSLDELVPVCAGEVHEVDVADGVIEGTFGLGLLAIKAGVTKSSLGMRVVLLASQISLLAAHLFFGIFEVLEGLALEATLKQVLLSEVVARLILGRNAEVLGLAAAVGVSVELALLHSELLLLGGLVLEAHGQLVGALRRA